MNNLPGCLIDWIVHWLEPFNISDKQGRQHFEDYLLSLFGKEQEKIFRHRKRWWDRVDPKHSYPRLSQVPLTTTRTRIMNVYTTQRFQGLWPLFDQQVRVILKDTDTHYDFTKNTFDNLLRSRSVTTVLCGGTKRAQSLWEGMGCWYTETEGIVGEFKSIHMSDMPAWSDVDSSTHIYFYINREVTRSVQMIYGGDIPSVEI